MVHSTKAISNEVRQIVVNLITSGYSAIEIFKQTGVSASTQRAFKRKAEENNLNIIRPNRKGSNNPNAKATEEYLIKLRHLIVENNDWFDYEYADEMHEQTEIKLSVVSIGLIRK
jgi:transposase